MLHVIRNQLHVSRVSFDYISMYTQDLRVTRNYIIVNSPHQHTAWSIVSAPEARAERND